MVERSMFVRSVHLTAVTQLQPPRVPPAPRAPHDHPPAITMRAIIAAPMIAGLVYRAWSHKSLTPVGIATAFVTAVVHAIHPWAAFFLLLATFFLAGTTVTKVRARQHTCICPTNVRRSNMTSRPSSHNLPMALPAERDLVTTSRSLRTQAWLQC